MLKVLLVARGFYTTNCRWKQNIFCRVDDEEENNHVLSYSAAIKLRGACLRA